MEDKRKRYEAIVRARRTTIAQFDRALVTLLRKELSDEDLTALVRLFNFELLEMIVGEDGIKIRDHHSLVEQLRLLRKRIDDETYRDENLEFLLPAAKRTLAELQNHDTA